MDTEVIDISDSSSEASMEGETGMEAEPINEVVNDAFAAASLANLTAMEEKIKEAWVANKVQKDMDIEANLASCSIKPPTVFPMKEEKQSTTKKTPKKAESSSSFSWHNLPQPEITADTKFVRQGGQMVPIIMMPKVTRIPPVKTWTLATKNFRAPNDAPHNLPYFEDEVVENDKQLVKEIEDGMLDRLTLSTPAAMSEADEQTFYDAVCEIQKRIPGQQSAKRGKKTIGSVVPSNEVFEAIANDFPKYGTMEEAKDRFIELLRKRHEDGDKLSLPGPVASSMVANADNDDDYGSESVDRSKSLHSYRKLFCRRCFVYDCSIHDDKDREQFIGPEFIQKKGPLKIQKESCSPYCYTNPGPKNDEKPTSSKSMKSKASTSTEAAGNDEQEFADWKPAEISMFRSIKDIFPNNYCAMSEILLKPCIQVYEFALKDDSQALTTMPVDGAGIVFAKPSCPKKSFASTSKGQRTGMVWGPLSAKVMEQIAKRIYKPCFHPGIPCGDSDLCTCKESKTTCEKFCACEADCKHRYVGCRCTSTCNYKSCPCFAAYRECDPDLCSTCGASELEPENIKCKNVSIQKMLTKKLKMAESDIPNAGWGIFAGEAIAKNEFISEYVGEIITSEEGDRRALENKARCHTYLMELNELYTVDAGRLGCKIRFANHSSSPNAEFRLMKVNTDHRIGIYALRNIEPGEEIFLSYEWVITEHNEVVADRKKKRTKQLQGKTKKPVKAKAKPAKPKK